MEEFKITDLTPDSIADYGVCGYKDAKKHPELQKKIDWFTEYYPLGLRIKVISSGKGEYKGMLEYIPGEYAHRPVDAQGYLFIHCIFMGFRKEDKGQGYGTALIEACINEAEAAGKDGVAVVTRKGSFMATDDIFSKLGFEVVDTAEPDFHLMAKKFTNSAKDPAFRKDMTKSLEQYREGLTILRSPQCPYTEKNVNAIMQTARDEFHMDANLIELADAQAVQNAPNPFGTFCIIYNGKIISHHPVSNTRFENIMREITGNTKEK